MVFVGGCLRRGEVAYGGHRSMRSKSISAVVAIVLSNVINALQSSSVPVVVAVLVLYNNCL